MSRLAAVLLVLALPVSTGNALSDSRAALVRIRIIITTESAAADLTFDHGTIVQAAIDSTDPSVVAHAAGQALAVTRSGRDGGEVHFRLLIAGWRPRGVLQWHLQTSPATPTRVEIYNENDRNRTTLVDRFDANAAVATFESPAELLLTGGPVQIDPGPPPLVLAFYYPWYLYSTWSSSRLRDQPLSPYSNENPEEVAQSLA